MAGGITLQSAVTTGTGTAFNFRGQGGLYTFSVQPSGTITAGEVQFESAPSVDYSGTWQPIGSAVPVLDGALSSFTVEDRFHAVRSRVTDTVTGSSTPTVTTRVAPPMVPR
jgi:hypothetical protein